MNYQFKQPLAGIIDTLTRTHGCYGNYIQAVPVGDEIFGDMVTNVHERGNCSVVCMQRLPYDLMRGALQPDSLQGFAINRNLDWLKEARLVLVDSVGAGMTRSSFLQRV